MNITTAGATAKDNFRNRCKSCTFFEFWLQRVVANFVDFTKRTIASIFDFGKELLAFFVATYSVSIGLALAIASFILAYAIHSNLWMLLPCAVTTGLTFVFLIILPRYIYAWRYNFPQVPPRGTKSRYLARIKKEAGLG